jgi:hypothetical protein
MSLKNQMFRLYHLLQLYHYYRLFHYYHYYHYFRLNQKNLMYHPYL